MVVLGVVILMMLFVGDAIYILRVKDYWFCHLDWGHWQRLEDLINIYSDLSFHYKQTAGL